MDIYAQPHSIAPVVWMQQAPFDPSRRRLGVSGIHTSLMGERGSERLSNSAARKRQLNSIQTGSTSGDAKAMDAPTSGVSLIRSESPHLGMYATGDNLSVSRSSSVRPIAASHYEEVARLSDQRVRLLAARYEKSDTSAEVLARLAILDARLSEKAPRVSKAQLDALEKNLDTLVVLQKSREAIASKFAEISKR